MTSADPGRNPSERRPPSTGRRLDVPPSARFESLPEDGEGGAREEQPASPSRAVAYGTGVALVGAAAIVVLAGFLAVGVGLLVAALAVGRFVGLAIVGGAGGTMSRPGRVGLAVGLAVAAVALGQIGTWLWGRAEGGVLPFVDYLGQTFGILVPAEVLLAAAAAWWTAR